MSDKNTKRFSTAELSEMRARGAGRTDLARVRGLTDEEAERAATDDPEWRDVPGDWWKDAEPVFAKPKKLLSLRLDEDVVEWFRRQGPGYQTRMNAVLRAYKDAKSS